MWAGLGLTDQQLAQAPSADLYPPVFTANCRSLWISSLQQIPPGLDAAAAWAFVIPVFISRCRAANTSPFAGVHTSDNDRIVSALRASRRAVLKVLDNSKAFDMMTLKDVVHECHVGSKGLVLRVTAKIMAVDPTVERWLLQKPWPAFRLKYRGVYRKPLDHNTEMVFFNTGANMPLRWNVGYQISLPLIPQVPDPDRATNRDLANFVLNVLWHQVFISSRTREWHRRKI